MAKLQQKFTELVSTDKNKLSIPVIEITEALPTATNTDVGGEWKYKGPKNGGTDVGHLVTDPEGKDHIVKTGIAAGLLWQVAQKEAAGNTDGAKNFLGFNALNFIRASGLDQEKTSEEVKEIKAKYAELLYEHFSSYCETGAGQALLAGIKDGSRKSNTDDIHAILEHMYEKGKTKTINEILGIPAITDVICGAVSQQFVNGYQGTYLSDAQLPDASIIIDSNKRPYLASKFVSNAQGFDDFLLTPFIEAAGVNREDAIAARKTYLKAQSNEKEAKKNQKPYEWSQKEKNAKITVEKITATETLEKGKKALSQKIQKLGGLEGFYESIILRFIMGESADLGPDNMLIVEGKIINIDVTGCRYARADDFPDRERGLIIVGWRKILAPERIHELQKNLLDGNVFKKRYLDGLEPVHKAILEVLSAEIGPEKATAARENVLNYIAKLDQSLNTAAIAGVKDKIVKAIPDGRLPKPESMEIATLRAQQFFTDAIDFAKPLTVAQQR